ncbi:D-alanyl-D-alanine carboxypeptidase family protein [Clostridium minihomine]|uniref:D-alanyl-D-alanine carboxypeptidase family protein n=1 Tax=Clostridium minihomine TaxID=2045012 RepID=UPI000C76B44B|nr:D-alanyl-D-alanine carboxypeptidase family protein [Clostridium minihomine]
MNWKKRTISMLTAVCLLASVAIPAGAISNEEIKAPAAVLVEAQTGKVLYEKNPHEQRPAASITKVMTLLLVMEAIDSGKIALTDTVSASAHAASMGGSDIWLQQGETMSVKDLIKATVIMSANDAAVALAEHVAGTEDDFLRMMNEKAKELGMNDTTFKNCNGLDEDGHLTSAYDVALMSAALLRHEEITEYTLTWIDHVRDGKTQLVNTNKLIRSYKGITGLKTGTTSKAGSCISASAKRGEVSLIAVILGSSTTDDRFASAAKLLDYGFANWSMAAPETPILELVPVKNGMKSSVEPETLANPSILVPKGKESEVASQVVLSESLEAPVEKGQVIGKITYKLGEETLLESNIQAKEAVEKITFFSVFQLLCSCMIAF